ncbi:MAG: hypothetical protein FJ138_02430 [Deltaproteobacteria bacterium]|nr:hypothetical protein [Deltaproteobacteria bacterium]
MIRLCYTLTLTDPASLSGAPGRGIGGGLDFVPGANLLGLVARHYAEAQARGLSWDLFHSGRVRFGDARRYPQGERAPSVRSPLSLHAPKGVDKADAQAHTLNFTRFALDARTDVLGGGQQLELVRSELTPSGDAVSAPREQGYLLKTAINIQTQRADEGRLFGHSTLKEQLRFGFSVSISDGEGASVEELKRFVEEKLALRARVGRARSAEFGGVTLSRVEPTEARAWEGWSFGHGERQDALFELDGDELACSYLLMSDACLLDPQTAQPTLSPAPEHLGLRSAEGFVVDNERTFLRATRWSPFNAHRARPDMERVALLAGGVITVRAPRAAWGGLRWEDHTARLSRGLGAYTAEGLGEVCVGHPLLLGETPLRDICASGQAARGARDASLPAPPAAAPRGLVGAWVKQQVTELLLDEHAQKLAKTLVEKRFEGFISSEGTPSQTQWRAVERQARELIHSELGQRLLSQRLFGDVKVRAAVDPHESDAGRKERERSVASREQGLLMRGKQKQAWRINNDDLDAVINNRGSLPAKTSVGVCLARVVTGEHIQAEQATLDELRQALSPYESKDRDIVERLTPLVTVHLARTMSQKVQEKSREEQARPQSTALPTHSTQLSPEGSSSDDFRGGVQLSQAPRAPQPHQNQSNQQRRGRR